MNKSLLQNCIRFVEHVIESATIELEIGKRLFRREEYRELSKTNMEFWVTGQFECEFEGRSK